MRASAIIVKNDQVLLIHRKKEGREYWVFPGGGVEDGETKEQAVIREVKEETSLDVTDCVFSFDHKDNKGDLHPVFICRVEDGEPEFAPDAPELLINSHDNWYHPEWISLEKALTINLYPEDGKKVLLKFKNKLY